MSYTTQQRNLWFSIYPEDIWKVNSKGKLRQYIFIPKKRSIKRENKVSTLSIPQNIATQCEECNSRKVHITSLLQLTGPVLPHTRWIGILATHKPLSPRWEAMGRSSDLWRNSPRVLVTAHAVLCTAVPNLCSNGQLWSWLLHFISQERLIWFFFF